MAITKAIVAAAAAAAAAPSKRRSMCCVLVVTTVSYWQHRKCQQLSIQFRATTTTHTIFLLLYANASCGKYFNFRCWFFLLVLFWIFIYLALLIFRFYLFVLHFDYCQRKQKGSTMPQTMGLMAFLSLGQLLGALVTTVGRFLVC